VFPTGVAYTVLPAQRKYVIMGDPLPG
jgi:hypothetical protein